MAHCGIERNDANELLRKGSESEEVTIEEYMRPCKNTFTKWKKKQQGIQHTWLLKFYTAVYGSGQQKNEETT